MFVISKVLLPMSLEFDKCLVQVAMPKSVSKPPGELLRMFVMSYINDEHLHEDLKKEIPKKWEKYGDFVLFDAKSFSSEIWLEQGAKFWGKICEILKCKRLALKNKIQNDGYRTPNVKILIGEDPWITTLDNSIRYTWNVQKNMFCAGNASERQRIAKLDCKDEVIVDMFAGIGYFVLPFLIHAKADFVHACEWNPDAVTALRKNLKLNNVESKCLIYEGDNLEVCPKGVADRVNLGLIPTTEKYWKVACQSLRPKGGTLYIHGNVETMNVTVTCEECLEMAENVDVDCKISLETGDKSLKCEKWDFKWKHRQWLVWGIHVLHSIRTILWDINWEKKWICSIENVYYVKSYAPHIHHLVLDVRLVCLETPDEKN